MTKRTLRARLIEALETRGCKRVEHRTTKYTVLEKLESMTGGRFYFVGKSGSLRTGKTVSTSASLKGLPVYLKLLEEVPA
jgi:hypothetical protein